jgi:fatty-acyl-CoA synthase
MGLSVTFRDDFSDATLPSALADACERWGEREAYVFEDGRLSFLDVGARAASVAAGLTQLGIGRDDRVAVLMAGYHDWPAIYFGVASLGAVLVPLNTRLTPHELRDLIQRSGACAVIYRADSRGRDLQGRVRAAVDRGGGRRVPELVAVIGADPGPGEIAFEGVPRAARSGALRDWASRLAPDSLAAIIYTSGSTGTPKGAMLNHRAMLRGAWYASRLLDATADDRIFSPQPFFHAGGAIHMMLAPVVSGTASVVQAYFDCSAALAIMARERCTLALGHQPHWVDYLADPGVESCDLSLRSAYVIGDTKIRREIYERLGIVTISPYAMTETHLGGVSPLLADGVAACLETNGRPFPGVVMTVRDVETDEPVPAGHVGEICLGGWCPMLGYLDEPELTAQAFDQDGAIRTGDLGVVGEDGNLRLVGRRKEMIRVGGENVSAGEVAGVLMDHPAVKQAVVVAIQDERLGELVGAAIQLHDGATPDIAGLEEHCRERLARYKLPRHLEIVEEWPMTGTGKIDRMAVQRQLDVAAQAGRRA